MPYEGIIFDFNGVLWWDARLVEECWQRTARQLRGREFTAEEFRRVVHGRNNRDTTEYLAGRPLAEAEIRRLVDEREALYRELCLREGENFRLSPGAKDLIDFLRDRGIPRTIATASEKTNVDFFVRELHLEEWFNPGKIVYDNGLLKSKPAPDFYLQAAASLGLTPSRCVVVEDSISGIRAARAAGIGYVIGLARADNREAILPEGSDATVETLGQVDRERLFRRG